MKASVVTFPGSNCDRDLAVAFEKAGFEVARVWHKETALPEGTDVVGLPGGFSHGDYLRCGAMAARAKIMGAVSKHAERGGFVLGICNGFQVMCEAGLLPGVLMRNASLSFICKTVPLRIASQGEILSAYRSSDIALPIAHHDGNYQADEATLNMLESEGRVAIRYADTPNGAARDIAGITSANGRVLGMMPHPERAIDDLQGNTDGAPMFEGFARALVTA